MTVLMINIFLVSLMVVLAVLVLRTRQLLTAILLAGAYSLICAMMFVNLDAVDVAFTEAAVGAGISTVLFLATITHLPREEAPRSRSSIILPMLVCLVAGVLLVAAVLALPPLGDPQSVVHSHVAPRYLAETDAVLHIPNAVTTVLASYRGFDTLGEVIVVFAAGLGVSLALGVKSRKDKTDAK